VKTPIALFLLTTAALPVDEAWLDDDAEARALAVNEGELVFLTEPPAKPAHQHVNRLRVTELSLRDGWVSLEQCHSNLDPVPEAEIVFRRDRVRGLEVTQAEAIGAATVEGPSVQLRDVRPGATLCLRAETRALHSLGDGLYELRNGPYMRRFLDGYYPLRVVLDIRYPASIELVDFQPEDQPGFRPELSPQHVRFDTWFEGRLQTLQNKTLRYPGHYAQLRAFYDLGLWDLTPIRVGDVKVVPRDVFHALFEPKVTFPGDKDMVVLRVKAVGKKDGHDAEAVLELIDYFDEETGFTAMERCTGWSAAIVAEMMARGEIPPGAGGVETQVPARPFVEQLRQRGIEVAERVLVE